ncbi:MAG: FG-GAP repeat protein, partial [Saprospiraceae bacterium]
DCDDTNTAIHPAASETCNGLDDDCDDLVDQADPGLVDNDPPTAACKPAHLTLRPDGTASLAAAAVNDGSTDNCTAAGDLVLAVWPSTFGCADAGTAMATLTVADGMGNTATCAATVTVLDVLYHSQEVQRMAADGLAGDNLGWGIGLDGPTAIVGAPYDKVGTQSKQGSAYVFLQNQGGSDNWGQLKQIKASDGAAVDYFGNAISMDGGLALVAAHGDNVGATADAGSVYVFEQNLPTGNNWGQQANIIARNGAASDAAAYDYFGN